MTTINSADEDHGLLLGCLICSRLTTELQLGVYYFKLHWKGEPISVRGLQQVIFDEGLHINRSFKQKYPSSDY